MRRYLSEACVCRFVMAMVALIEWGCIRSTEPKNPLDLTVAKAESEDVGAHNGRSDSQLVLDLEWRLHSFASGLNLDARLPRGVAPGPSRNAFLRECLADPKWAGGWRHIAQILAITSHDEATFLALRDYVTRWDAAEDLKGGGPSILDFGKIEAVAVMGCMPLPMVLPFLFQLVDNESCRQIFAHWPEGKNPDRMESNKDFFIQSIRGRAALGLVLTKDPRGIRYVRHLHTQLSKELLGQEVNFAERTSPSMLKFELLFNLKDALVAHEVVIDLGVEQYIEWRIHSPDSSNALAPYYKKLEQMEWRTTRRASDGFLRDQTSRTHPTLRQ